MKDVRPASTEAVHLLAEAGRLAFADRDRYLADDRFIKVPVSALTDGAYIRQRSELIMREKAMGKAEAGILPHSSTNKLALADGISPELPSTSHISIVDKFGNAVGMTTSIESSFGSHLFVQGFFLNNQMTDFSLSPAPSGTIIANAIQPGKRPRSAMAPTLVFDADDRLHMVLGSPGGPSIINYVGQTLVAALDWQLDIQAAVALPHFGSRNGPTELERGTSVEKLSGALQAMGHVVRVGDFNSGLHGIMRTSQGWQGGADPRREGIAKGR
jgi:gamma-glutamyltranspeptidase/glutathione hydrolase